jgi:hypothetical protein
MIRIMINLKSKCPACGWTIAVNALVPGVPCSKCGKAAKLDLGWWKTVLHDAIRKGSKLKPGKTTKSSSLSSGFDMKVERLDPRTGKSGSTRPVPDEYRELIPGVQCLVGEDLDLRTKKASRWYLWHDEHHAPFEWEGEVTDAVAGEKGHLFLVLEPRSRAGGGKVVLACLDRTYRQTWVRDDLKCIGEPKLAICRDGRLLVWTRERNAFTILSPENGSQVGKLLLKKCGSLAVDLDGTLLVFRKITDYYGPARYDMNGAELPVWPEPEIGGLFKKMKGFLSITGMISSFEDIGDRFAGVREPNVELSVGRDGSYYFQTCGKLAKLDGEGGKIYIVDVPWDGTHGRACADEEGRAFVIGNGRLPDEHAILRVSPDGKEIDTFVPSVLRGGTMGSENLLARSIDGILYAVGPDGCLRVFSPEGYLVHASARSLEKEKALLEKARKAQA